MFHEEILLVVQGSFAELGVEGKSDWNNAVAGLILRYIRVTLGSYCLKFAARHCRANVEQGRPVCNGNGHIQGLRSSKQLKLGWL